MSLTTVKRIRTRVARSNGGWDKAIADAQRQLKIGKERVARLEEIVADLEKMKKSGELWPGTQKTAGTAREAIPA